MLDPVMEKAIIKKGKNLYITVSDQNMEPRQKDSAEGAIRGKSGV